MKLFHIGIRTTEIVTISPSKDKEHPTEYSLKNGNVIRTTGTWADNVKAVEAALSAELYPERVCGESVEDIKLLRRWLEGETSYMGKRYREALERILEQIFL